MHLFKPTEGTQRVSPKVNYRLCVLVMGQYKFTDYNKCSTLVGDVNNQGSYVCAEAGYVQEALYLLHFAIDQNCSKILSLKN